jgi:uncharacterized protein YbjT (DUF2867 family)
MDVAIAGGHGKVGLRLGRLLAERGDGARGLIRREEQADDLRAAGVEPVVCDMEAACDLVEAIAGVDAVVFAAGAGPGSGTDRKWTVDYGGAVKLILAARAAGVRRYLMVSSMGTQDPPAGDDVFSIYVRAKAKADEELRASGLDWTIVRPGRLTDDPGTGLVTAGESVDYGEIPRDDVAAALLAVLDEQGTVGVTLEVVSGETPIAEAVAALAAS